MSDISGFARGAAFWLIPLALVAAALGFETDWGRAVVHPPPAPSAAAPQPVAVALLPEYRIDGGVEARKETVDRVLFNPTRRPAPPAPQAAGANSTMQRGLYTLTGTTLAGNVTTAFLREVKGGKSRSVRKGETISGMLVADIAGDHVRLTQGDEVEDLSLKVAAGPRTTNQPAAVPAAAAAQAAAAAATQPPQSPGGSPNPVRTPNAQVQSVSEILAERRRAAQAAAAAVPGGAAAPVDPRWAQADEIRRARAQAQRIQNQAGQ